MLIAIAVWDTEKNDRSWMTWATLESLSKTVDWDRHRLFISDNGSCDKTKNIYVEMINLLPFDVLYNGKNIGTAGAINQCWQHRRPGEHAVKMDNDVVMHQAGWADWIEDVFARDPSIGICGLKRRDLLECPWAEREQFQSTIRMLPHVAGQRWLVVEEVQHVIGTCQGYSSALLDRIGYLVQPHLYGFDDGLSAVRARLAGFKSVFLHGFEIEHLDPGHDNYAKWKKEQAAHDFPAYNSERLLYESGVKDVYYDGL